MTAPMAVADCIRWEIVPGIDFPAADISISYESPFELSVRMNFSDTVDGPNEDLQIDFDHVHAFQWESESFGLIPLPRALPKCRLPQWSLWTFPLLQCEESSWATAYRDNQPQALDCQHFVFISMNDLLHVLASPNIHSAWVKPRE